MQYFKICKKVPNKYQINLPRIVFLIMTDVYSNNKSKHIIYGDINLFSYKLYKCILFL